MRYAAAYLLAVLGGNASPQLEDIRKILDSVGILCNEDTAKLVIGACEGKDTDKIIENTMKEYGMTSGQSTGSERIEEPASASVVLMTQFSTGNESDETDDDDPNGDSDF
ncbi:unnamed protein product, partial [Adineta ricciae]